MQSEIVVRLDKTGKVRGVRTNVRGKKNVMAALERALEHMRKSEDQEPVSHEKMIQTFSTEDARRAGVSLFRTR